MTVTTAKVRCFIAEWETLRDKQVDERRRLLKEAIQAGERVHLVCYRPAHEMMVKKELRGALVASSIDRVPEDELKVKYFDIDYEY